MCPFPGKKLTSFYDSYIYISIFMFNVLKFQVVYTFKHDDGISFASAKGGAPKTRQACEECKRNVKSRAKIVKLAIAVEIWWKDDSMVKATRCSPRVSRFNSQHPQLSVALVPRYLTPSSEL